MTGADGEPNPWVAPGWFLAVCLGCEPPLPQPFRARKDRDTWAAAHTEGTGHYVARAEGQ